MTEFTPRSTQFSEPDEKTYASASRFDTLSVGRLEALRSGNRQAFEEVYLMWRKPIHTLLSRLTGSADDADDIVQEVFIKLWEKHENIDPSKDIRTLLYVMARNAALGLFRHRKVRSNYAEHSAFDDIDATTSYEIVVEKECILLAEIAVSRMEPQRRKIYEMSDKQSMTPEQIADNLGISPKTVYNQLYLARKEIRELITVFILLFTIHAK